MVNLQPTYCRIYWQQEGQQNVLMLYLTHQIYSIKNADHVRRSKGTVHFKNIVPSSKIQQWAQFLSSNSSRSLFVANGTKNITQKALSTNRST